MFFGKTAEDLANDSDSITDEVADTLRGWIDLANKRGVAAVFEAAQLEGMDARVLGVQRGERHMTDLAHVCQLLQEAAHAEHLGLPGLRDWLHRKREDSTKSSQAEHLRRLDRDTAAVQIMTVHASKGLEYPIVYLPFAFTRSSNTDGALLFHDEDDARCLYIGAKNTPGRAQVEPLYLQEEARNNIRLTYVALTRAQSQVVAWWAPGWNEAGGGLSRLMRYRNPGEAHVPDTCDPEVSDDAEVMAHFKVWEQAGGPSSSRPSPWPPPHNHIARSRRLVRQALRPLGGHVVAAHLVLRVDPETQVVTVESEPEETGHDDESGDIPVDFSTSPGADVPSPMAELPGGREFGNLVHGVLEHVDPFAPDLTAELTAHIAEQLVRSPVDVSPACSPPRCCRCTTPRSARWRRASYCATSVSRIDCASGPSSSRWPVGTPGARRRTY